MRNDPHISLKNIRHVAEAEQYIITLSLAKQNDSQILQTYQELSFS